MWSGASGLHIQKDHSSSNVLDLVKKFVAYADVAIDQLFKLSLEHIDEQNDFTNPHADLSTYGYDRYDGAMW